MSFEVYGPAGSQPAAIRALYRSLLSRQALTLYSFGRRKAARRLWLLMSRDNRLDPGPLHNIAVSSTVEGESDRALTAWKACAEAEYFQAVEQGSPRIGAQARAHLHREIGAAFGPAALRAEQHPSQVKVDAQAIWPGFSPAQHGCGRLSIISCFASGTRGWISAVRR